MTRKLLTSLLLSATLLTAACRDKTHDIDFAGTVVDYEYCTSHNDIAYAIQISAPDTLGRAYLSSDSITYPNVVVVYGANRLLHANDHVSGTFYLDDKYSEAYCTYHYRDQRGNVPEAHLTKLKVTP